MNAGKAQPGSAPEPGRHEAAPARWPWDSHHAWAMVPQRRKRQRGREGRLREEAVLARLRRTWGDTYKIPEPPRRRWPGRTELAAWNTQTGFTLTARSADALEQAILQDYTAMLARTAHARVAAEEAAARARTQAVPVFTRPPAPRPYTAQNPAGETRRAP